MIEINSSHVVWLFIFDNLKVVLMARYRGKWVNSIDKIFQFIRKIK